MTTDTAISAGNFNAAYENLVEELIINDITFSSMPSDITSYASNAVLEDTFMRSKAVFSIRSKYAKGKVILTIPISIDFTSTDSLAYSSRDEGIRLMVQANNYPFVFVKSSRIYSYLGDKAKKSSTGFMMFAVDELKTIHVIDVQDVLFLELTLVYCDHTSQTKDFSFMIDPTQPLAPTVKSLAESTVWMNFVSQLRTRYGNLDQTLEDLNKLYLSQQRENALVSGSLPLSQVFLFAPDIISKNNQDEIAAEIAAAKDGKGFYPKEIKITSHFGDQSYSDVAINQANGVGVTTVLPTDGDGNTVAKQDQTVNTDYLYVVWKAFHSLDMNGDGNVQRITCSRKNKLATLFIGTHQNPFIQYMGRYPARVEINMAFNSGESYKLKTEASIAALNQLSNIIDANNSLHPEASAYNTYKIKCVATDALNIVNLVPNQTSISASSTTQGVEDVTITLIETHMEEYLDLGNVVNGRAFSASSAVRDKALVTYLNLISSTPTDQLKDNELHIAILAGLFDAYGQITSELSAASGITDQTIAAVTVAKNSLKYFPKELPKNLLQATASLITSRSTIIAERDANAANGGGSDNNAPVTGTMAVTTNNGITTTSLVTDTKKVAGSTQTLALDTFKQSGLAENLLNTALIQLSSLKDRGDPIAISALASESSSDVSGVSAVITAQVMNYTGTNIPDLNLDLVGLSSNAYINKIPPFFFIASTPYFVKQNILDAVEAVNDSVNVIYDQVVNSPVGYDGSLANQGFVPSTLIGDEKIFSETSASFISAASNIQPSAPGVPSSLTFAAAANAGMVDWNSDKTSLNQRQAVVKQAIIDAVAANTKISDYQNGKLYYTRFAIQVAGKESRLGLEIVNSKGSGAIGVFQMFHAAVQDATGLNASAAKAKLAEWAADASTGATIPDQVKIGIDYLLICQKHLKSAKIKNYTWFDIFGMHNLGIGVYLAVKKAAQTNGDVKGNSEAISGIAANLPGTTVTAKTGGRIISGSAADVQLYAGPNGYLAQYFANVTNLAGTANSQTNANINTTPVMDAKGTIARPAEGLAASCDLFKITSIIDGDSIKGVIKGTNKVVELRFADIDAPETQHPWKRTVPLTLDGKATQTTFTGVSAEQPYGEEAKRFLSGLVGGVGQYIYVSKSDTKVNESHQRLVTNLFTKDGGSGDGTTKKGEIPPTSINEAMVNAGYAWPTNVTLGNNDPYLAAFTSAKTAKRGLWRDSKPIIPADWRATQENIIAVQLAQKVKDAQNNTSGIKLGDIDKKDVAPGTDNSTGTIVNTNTYNPVRGNNYMTSPFGDPKRIGFHHGIDFGTHGVATPVVAAADGVVLHADWQSQQNHYGDAGGYGLYVSIDHGNGYKTIYGHLSEINVKAGQNVKAEQQIGLTGNTGHSVGVHLHYQVEFNGIPVNPVMTPLLSGIPHSQKNAGINLNLYRPNDKAYQYSAPGTFGAAFDATLGRTGLGNPNDGEDARDAANNNQNAVPSLLQVNSRGIPKKLSVFSEDLQIDMQADVMTYMQNFNINTAYPCIKAYITVGNENEDTVIGQYIKLDQYFEITGLQDFKLVCNDDTNPVDMVTLRIANPSFIKEDKYAVAGVFLVSDLSQLGTSLESQFMLDRMVLKAGMKLHIRAGYGTDPNGLKTIFNGSIVDISSDDNYAMDLVCEGFGKELLSYYLSPEKMTKAGGTFTNSSTPLIFGEALNVDTIAHFGTRLGFWRAILTGTIIGLGTLVDAGSEAVATASFLYGHGVVSDAIVTEAAVGAVITNPIPAVAAIATESIKAVIAGVRGVKDVTNTAENSIQESSGANGGLYLNDYKDPESKRMTTWLSKDSLTFGLNFRLSNYRQRIFTNIYAAEIEDIDGEYSSSLLRYLSNSVDMGKEAGYHYMFYNTTPWDAMKEMEHRHPGTLCKPLFYEDRMTMFYGIKEQLYIARDLDTAFMSLVATTKDDTLTAQYLGERPKRFEPVAGFHILSSNLNILTNTMGINNKYATGVNIMYFNTAGDADAAKQERNNFKMVLDDDIASWDMRYKTICYNGCHGRYSAYMYGTNELRREAETMYSGKIRVTGDPTIKAGDYAYLSDNFRKLTGIIKVRECVHIMNSEDGFVTEIVPGQYVECRKFVYSMMFLKLGFAAKAVMAASDLALKLTETGDGVLDDYYNTFSTLAQWTHTTTISEMLTDSANYATEGIGTLTGLLILSSANMLTLSNNPLTPFWDSAIAISKNYGQSSALLRSYIGLGSKTLGGWVEGASRWDWVQRVAAHKTTTLKKAKDAINLTVDAAKLAAADIRKASILGRFTIWLAEMPTSLIARLGGLTARAATSSIVGSVVFGAARALGAITTVASIALVSNPIGWLVDAVVSIVFSYVSMKIRDVEYGRNPLLFFPITHIGRPYVSGMAGYNHNSYWESIKLQFNKNLQSIGSAAKFYAMSNSSPAQHLLAGIITDIVGDPVATKGAAQVLAAAAKFTPSNTAKPIVQVGE
jgi:murein DD-endopeptidase MepM/ murein hydrolase activator NlpD